MDLQAMVLQLRDDVGDTDAHAFNAARVSRALHRAVRWTEQFLDRYKIVQFGTGYEDETTTSTAVTYALAAADILRPYRVARLDNNSEEDLDIPVTDSRTVKIGDELRVFFTQSGETWTLNFPWRVKGGVVYRVFYTTHTATQLTTPADDASTYSTIPREYHDLVVARAAFLLTASDASQHPGIAAVLASAMQDAKDAAQHKSSPSRILQDW